MTLDRTVALSLSKGAYQMLRLSVRHRWPSASFASDKLRATVLIPPNVIPL
jgi:hypothetical protein